MFSPFLPHVHQNTAKIALLKYMLPRLAELRFFSFLLLSYSYTLPCLAELSFFLLVAVVLNSKSTVHADTYQLGQAAILSSYSCNF